MSYERPGQSSGESIQRATGQKTLAERLLSLLSPKVVFITIGGGVLVSAALVLTLVAGSNGNGPVVKALQSYAGFNRATSNWWQPVDSRCPAGYRIDAFGRCIPTPKPPEPVTQLKLNISATPTTVVQGGSYTLSASYVDANGVAQKYAGLLDYQSRVCDLNNQNCQSGSGAWGDYTLVDGAVFIQLPSTIAVGIYNASFKPRAQDGWTWSNEIAITVNPSVVQPPVATGCNALGISGVTASSDTSLSSNPPSFAVDGRLDTFWNSGQYPPARITLDLGSQYSLTMLCLKVAMSPDGQVKHAVKIGSELSTATEVATINQTAHNGDWIEVPLSAIGRYVVVGTQQSPSWVAWTEIRAYGTLSGDNGGGNPPPPPTGCLTGSVRLTSNNIVVGGTTSVSSTLSGVAVTYDTTDHSIATVSGTSVTAGSTAGSTSVTGHFVYAGRSCDLTPATLTVTGGDAQGSVTASGTDLYLCTNNGTSNQTTLTVSVTRGSGAVDVAGAVTFQGPTRLNAPNTWTQVVSPGNFIGLNAASGGQASVTITLKDYFTGRSIDSKTITARINPPSCGSGTISGTFNVSPSTLALCAGETGTFNISVSGANYGGLIGKGGQIYATFNAPGGNWSDTVSSSMIGQTITYNATLQPLSGPVSLGSHNVSITQKSNCAPPQGSVSTSPMTLFIPDNQTCTYTVYGSANVAAYLKLGGVTLQYLTPNSPASSTLSTSNQNGTWNFSVVDQATGQQLASTYFSTARSSGSVCGMP